MRVSIITGGGSGIGAAVARRLAGPDQGLMAVVAFLLLKDAGHVTGALLPVDGGLTLM